MAHIELPLTYLARHGETAWSLSGQHTGLTDLPLTEVGEGNARRLRDALTGLTFAKVFCSPLRRARRTCELAGFGSRAEIVPDLLEWDYGEYEGRRTVEIHAKRPDWQLFRDGCPRGESPQQVAARADRVVELSAVSFRERSALFQRTFPPNVGRTMGRYRHIRGQVFDAEHCKPERSGLRTP